MFIYDYLSLARQKRRPSYRSWWCRHLDGLDDDVDDLLVEKMEKADNNNIFDGDQEEYPFSYNFINQPWDDRSKSSKIRIIALLLSIAVAIAIFVFNSIYFHYRGYHEGELATADNPCHLVRREDLPYVARIYSVSTKKLLCVGAVISYSSVIANEVCMRSGTTRLFLGSSTDPRCKKGFSVDMAHTLKLSHEGVVTKKILAIESLESIAACSKIIKLGLEIDWHAPAYVIGRPLQGNEKALTKQPVHFAGRGNCSLPMTLSTKLDKKRIICVKDVGHCLVRAGDLLVQHGQLFGIASTSAHRSDLYSTAFFADLSYINRQLQDKLNAFHYSDTDNYNFKK